MPLKPMSPSFRNHARWGILIAAAVAATPPVRAQVPKAHLIEPGISFYETDQRTAAGTSTRLWVYLPAHPKGKIPCIVMAAAGTTLIWGMNLSNVERVEHLPFARAGFAVVAYAVEGGIPPNPTNAQIKVGMLAFRRAHAGVNDAQAAIDCALHLPLVDAKRIYAVGHSSGGTLALLAAENDQRIGACVAYAPVCDVRARHTNDLSTLQQDMPDIEDFLVQSSPITHAMDLRCPLFLFHADDDDRVAPAGVIAFREVVAQTNPHVTDSSVATGGRYHSALDQGIPRSIAWLKALPKP